MNRDLSLLAKRRLFVLEQVRERCHRRGEKVDAVIYELSEKIFVSTRTLWRDLEYAEKVFSTDTTDQEG